MKDPVKAYLLLCALVFTISFAVGCWFNFIYARNTPGADPYLIEKSQRRP